MKSILEEFGYSKFDIENRVIECWNNIFDLKNPNHFYFEAEDNSYSDKSDNYSNAKTDQYNYISKKY